MKESHDPSWVTAYVEQGDLPLRALDQAVLCGELDMALAMDQCQGTDHLSSIVAMVDSGVPSEIRGDVEKVARHVMTFGKRNLCQSPVVWRLMKEKQKLTGRVYDRSRDTT